MRDNNRRESHGHTKDVKPAEKVDGTVFWKVAVFSTICLVFLAYTVGFGDLLQSIPSVGLSRVPAPGGLMGVLILLLLNLVAGKILKRALFTGQEIVTTYWMLALGGLVLTTGWFMYIIFPIMGFQKAVTLDRLNVFTYRPILSSFSALVFPKSREAVQGFWEGQSSVPWGEWIMPLILWGLFFMLALFFMICLGALMFGQWNRVDRLSYPLVQPILELAGYDTSKNSDKKSIWRDRLFLVGLVISAIPALFTSLSRYFPVIPTLEYQIDVEEIKGILPQPILYGFFMHWPPLLVGARYLRFRPLVVGIGYFVNLEVLFSIWSMSIVYGLFRSILVVFYGTGPIASPHGPIRPYMLIAGAYAGIVLYSIYFARHHIKETVLIALGKKSIKDDNSFPMSPRLIVLGGIISFVLLVTWTWLFLHLSPWLGALIFLLIAMIAMGFARIRAETGIPTTSTHGQFYEYWVIMDLFGRDRLGNANVAAMNFFTPFTWGAFDTFPTLFQEAWHSAERLSMSKRTMTRAMVFAALVALVVAVIVILPLIYKYGANLMDFYTIRFATWFDKEGFNGWGDRLAQPRLASLGVFTIGAGIAILLIALRTMYLWWPIHPIGFVLGIWEHAAGIWPSFMLAWAIKFLVYRYGGVQVFDKLKGLFIGLILGGVIIECIFAAIGLIVPASVIG